MDVLNEDMLVPSRLASGERLSTLLSVVSIWQSVPAQYFYIMSFTSISMHLFAFRLNYFYYKVFLPLASSFTTCVRVLLYSAILNPDIPNLSSLLELCPTLRYNTETFGSTTFCSSSPPDHVVSTYENPLFLSIRPMMEWMHVICVGLPCIWAGTNFGEFKKRSSGANTHSIVSDSVQSHRECWP